MTDYNKFIKFLKEEMLKEHEKCIEYYQKLLNGKEPYPKLIGLKEMLDKELK